MEYIGESNHSDEKYKQEVSHIEDRLYGQRDDPAKPFEVSQENEWTQPNSESCDHFYRPEIFFVSITRIVDSNHIE